MRRTLFLLAVLGLSTLSAIAQDNAVEKLGKAWQARATKTQAEQPKWAVPMYSPFPMVAQVFRLDYTRQRVAGGYDNWNIGGNKGFNFIPFSRTQIDVFIPGYILHGAKPSEDGFGDTNIIGKYRFASANEKHGNYALSAALGLHIPTGSYKNGAPSTVLTPSIIGGKGFGKLALFSSVGAAMPTSGTATSGRTIHWNSVAQYKVGKYLTPELELNSNTWVGGTRDGKTQMFLSPGLLSKIPLRPKDPTSRLSLILGVAFQTAVTSYHTHNHGLAVTTRFGF
ncbi:MAG: transporter [Acidobacteria bacterium]|nr:transporter [Acidobacteriota bacterium]